MATATIATASSSGYVGRFAPSPTGRLHLGSLTTAVASYLEARVRGGRWLLRIEDLDAPRIQPGASKAMIDTLDALGFVRDGPIILQSTRARHYQLALDRLLAAGQAYPCSCSRKSLQESDSGGGYPGTCRNGVSLPRPWATRFRIDDAATERIVDGLLGPCHWHLGRLGDPIVMRRDGLTAYQLAVVVDDANCGVTHVVRGADLLDSTPWQLALQRALNLRTPQYLHLPLVTAADGSKLSKSATAVALDPARAADWLLLALELLRQSPPQSLRNAGIHAIWDWAMSAWSLDRLKGISSMPHQGSLAV